MGSPRGESVAILTYQSMLALLPLGKSTSGSHGVECCHPPLDTPPELCISFPALVALALSKFLAEHVTGQFRFLVLVASGWKEAAWFPTILDVLKDISLECPIVKDLIIDVVVD